MYIHSMSKRASRTTRAFKSGNSIAVRLPASFGVKPGTEMRVREEQGRYIVEPVAGETGLAGAIGQCAEMKPAERLEIEFREVDWKGTRLKRD